MKQFVLQILTIGLLLIGVAPVSLTAQDAIPKFLLIQLTRDQSATMCASDTFTQCMGFAPEICLKLAESAVETCLGPLPDEIDPQTLENSSLEMCPQKVYRDAGYTEEKAKVCFDLAMQAAAR